MTQVSPVTEDEVQSFAQRIVTTIVSVSQQARELEGLKSRLDALASELAIAHDETKKLKGEVADTWEYVQTVERERDQARQDLAQGQQEAEARVQQAQQDAARAYSTLDSFKAKAAQDLDDLLRSNGIKDRRIAELEQAYTGLSREAEDWQVKANEAERIAADRARSLDYKQERIDTLRRDCETYSIALKDAHAELDVNKSKLATVQAKLNDLRSLFDAPKEESLFPPQTERILF